jgi:hypothetical protein
MDVAAMILTAGLPTSLPGTYALLLSASHQGVVQIGRLGPLAVQRGFYVYIGSAFGPGSVRARVAHHCRPAPRPHWHIDHLRTVTELSGLSQKFLDSFIVPVQLLPGIGLGEFPLDGGLGVSALCRPSEHFAA